MSVYLKDIPFEIAWDRWLQAMRNANLAAPLKSEIVTLDERAVGRVLAQPAWAKICSPHYHASAMDGFCLHSDLTQSATSSRPVQLIVGQDTFYVDTGDPLPEGMNAVVPIEQIEAVGEDGRPSPDLRKPYAIRVRAASAPWSYIRLLGEDMVASQLVLPAGHTLTPVDLGALAACGHTELEVVSKPRVHIFPTGTELIPVGVEITPGSIIEFNSIVLAGQMNGWGAACSRHAIIHDDFETIKTAVVSASHQADLLVLNAGSSAGSEDFSSRIVEEAGELLVHGVAIRPGHPVILGMIRDPEQPGRSVPIIGVPGYPVSAALTAEIFIKPLLAIWQGNQPDNPVQIQAKIANKTNSPAGDDDYIRVLVGRVGGEMLASPLPRGAGVISSLVRADGITVVPRGVQGLEEGEQVSVNLIRRPEVLERTLFFSGSHDLTLDILSDELSHYDVRVVCTNVGSLGGLVALRRGQAHAAGSHLLDPATGIYNDSYIRQYLKDKAITVVHWVKRKQGLIVRKGNFKHIESLRDLTRPDVTFINRQNGAGTRVLLDFQLKQMGVEPEQVKGYSNEEFTHLAVAAAVISGRADCGLGIVAAASALDCDFVPLYDEEYELLIPSEYMADELMLKLLEVAHLPEFRSRIAAMPGYEVNQMGEIRTMIED